MLPTPTVSVIVRTMGRDSLQRAVDCIAAQTHRPIEIVLVDAAARGSVAADCRVLPFRVVSQGRLNRPGLPA